MIKERLKYIREKLSKNASQFAKDNAIDARTYNNYETGDRLPPISFIERLSLKYNINLNWLILGTGHMFMEEYGNDDCYIIPIRGDVNASMGNGIEVYTEEETGKYPISKHLVNTLMVNPKTSEIIFAIGNSMEPTIYGGDSLLVDRSKTQIYDGRIYCVRYDNQLYAKRLQKISKDKIKMISDNKEYDPIIIDETIDFKVIGEIRWFGRILK